MQERLFAEGRTGGTRSVLLVLQGLDTSGKGGIVRDAALYGVVEQRLRDCCAALGLEVTAWFDSPIEGGDGNREFFLAARRGP